MTNDEALMTKEFLMSTDEYFITYLFCRSGVRGLSLFDLSHTTVGFVIRTFDID
jgi:hypothetical protein